MDITDGIKRIEARRNVTSGVEAWLEPVTIPTYAALPPDKNPMFLERRVYQGSSGKVYPLPFTDKVSQQKEDRVYEALHIENEYLYVMILPEIGGRIHIALDKTNDYDFVYRQNVIKPALVGLAGPWISGGIEINWPQHHRPSTFMPCEWTIEEHEDGSRTIWLSEHEPMNRMKGMHGVCLRPGSACLELKGRIYNRTPFVQTFLWWANVAARVNDEFQSFFPPDVRHVADHAKRATSTFPECTGFYYGVDYRPATGLDWYKNIPVPTSYMVVQSEFDFFGGYDHGRAAGFVHVADRHIAPGKKQWTWGNHEFGYAWDRNLTDEDGPYIELMAGVYTDNQPDFSFLNPYETRAFRQLWYPIQEIGPAVNATEHAALSVRIAGDEATIGISPSRPLSGVLEVEAGGETVRKELSTKPGSPWQSEFTLFGNLTSVRLLDGQGRVLVDYSTKSTCNGGVVGPATEPPSPAETASVEELYLTGLHLEQYRHATRRPELYWLEGLERDALDARCNQAMARWRLRRGEYDDAERHARDAITRLTARNPNPLEGEPFYVLGMVLERKGRTRDAVAAYAKATWSYAWAEAAHYRLACLHAAEGSRSQAEQHLQLSQHPNARLLEACLARGGAKQSKLAESVLKDDPLNHWALREAGRQEEFRAVMRGEPQNYLDLAIDYAEGGQFEDAIGVLQESPDHPMVHYARAYYTTKLGEDSTEALVQAAQASCDYCFPSRLEEIDFLQHAIENNPDDSKAPYYLGNLLYDKGRYEGAICLWERSVALDPGFPVSWRNLGIACFNVRHDPAKAREAYDRAFEADPKDARLLFERDQLHKRLGASPRLRLDQIEANLDLARARDDLSLELCALYNQTGQPEKALAILAERRFNPWEGGEGVALGQWVRTHLILGRRRLEAGDAPAALEHFRSAECPPQNLGEARHLLANASDVWFWLGEALVAMGQIAEAADWWSRAAEFRGDFQEMSVREFSEMTYYQALSLRRLGRRAEAEALLHRLLSYGKDLESQPAKIDYFATSLPTMLLFEDDLKQRQTIQARILQAQALAGLGQQELARTLLHQALEADPNHPLAAEFLSD